MLQNVVRKLSLSLMLLNNNKERKGRVFI